MTTNLPVRRPGGVAHRGVHAVHTPAASATPAAPLTELLTHSARALDILAAAVAELEALKPRQECPVSGCGANLAGCGDTQRADHMRSHGVLRGVLRRWLG